MHARSNVTKYKQGAMLLITGQYDLDHKKVEAIFCKYISARELK
jgi:hypothetical protein